MFNSSLFTPALLGTHSLVFFAVHETRRIFLSPFTSKASIRVSVFFLSVQLSQPYVATCHTSAFISRIIVKIGNLYVVTFPYPQDTPTKSRASLLLDLLQAELRMFPQMRSVVPDSLQSSPRQLLFTLLATTTAERIGLMSVRSGVLLTCMME